MELFDYIKQVLSKNESQWKEISRTDKSRNFFMLNRIVSIQFPIQALLLSHYKIDAVSVSNFWHRTLSSKYVNTPSWVYAKTIKKKDVEKKLNLPSDEMIKWYCNKNEMSRTEFNTNVDFFGETFLSEIRSLEKILKSQGIFKV